MGAGAKEDYGGAKPPEPPLALLLRIAVLTWRIREGGLELCSSGSTVPSQDAVEKGLEPKSSCSQRLGFSLCTA